MLPILSKNGIVLTQSPSFTQIENTLVPTLVTTIIHADSGETTATEMLLMHAKDDPQGQGSAITYARRYSLLSILGLVADEDDDGNSASQGTGTTPRRTAEVGGAL